MIGWVFLAAGLAGGALLSGGVTFAAMAARERIVVNGAVSAEKKAGVVACNARVMTIETAHNAAVGRGTGEAVAAANAITPTPEAAAGILELCKRSASCRSRKQ